MRFPEDCRHRAVFGHAPFGLVHGAHDQPGPGKVFAVPGERRAGIGDDVRLPGPNHAAGLDLFQVDGQKLQTVRRLPHEIAFDQHRGHDTGAIARQTRPLQQLRRESLQIRSPIAFFRHVSHPSYRFCR